MLTQTVTINQNSNPNIIIGRRSTYETQQVIFDVSWLIKTYGEGTAELLIKRPKDASAYPVIAVLDGNALTWTVSETDTQDKGHGECEIYWYVNGGLAKSCICGITILRDIGDTTETAPDPYETWVETLSRLGAETLTNAQAAEQSANDAAQSASEADNSAAAALESEENALNSENAAKASEQAAAASEQGAEQSATEAAQSASSAESSANDAQESADNASASADRAEQAAASIEGDTERAEAAARTAQGAASDASGFAGTASTKATEASQSAATAEQAATTATQKAAGASASATAAVDSASSASASATAAGNAQTAAETAQGKAEDAQEAAETAAQSIEDSAAQIDQNAEDILNLKSAIEDLQDLTNRKAGMLIDTASGAIASFIPDSTIPDLLGVSVDIEPVQDLHGYDAPWPGGGGVNQFDQDTVLPSIGFVKDGDAWFVQNSSTPREQIVWENTSEISGSVSLTYTYKYNSTSSQGVRFQFMYTDGTSVDNYAAGRDGYYTASFTSYAAKTLARIKTTYGTGSVSTWMKDVQVKFGSAEPYSPYENLCHISGWDEVGIDSTGENLLPYPPPKSAASRTETFNPETCFFLKQGTYTFAFDRFDNATSWRFGIVLFDARKERYYVPSEILGNDFGHNDSGRYYVNGSNRTDTVFSLIMPFDGFIRLFFLLGDTTDASVCVNPRICIGTTASEYKPFAGNRYTIQLGQTVYGGTLDVAAGTLTIDRVMPTLDRATLYRDNGTYKIWKIVDLPNSVNIFGGRAICNITNVFGNVSSVALETKIQFPLGTQPSMFASIPADFNIADLQACYELATPLTIDLDPVTIAAIAGQTNNVWADAGDVDITYAADLKTYIDSKIAAAVAALS